ncbi:hypothetical protein LVISKB_0281 [Levilactobacillus brevis KB290]|uniref:Uncharacterized protein n=1 Tax=Levilactobacillus brevis KB290 TaxID=1001583 RepID=M5AXW4_LEVBR|nr:hypothetical protein LVISKB_0281 [Levilactobacillus brevis KB290]
MISAPINTIIADQVTNVAMLPMEKTSLCIV